MNERGDNSAGAGWCGRREEGTRREGGLGRRGGGGAGAGWCGRREEGTRREGGLGRRGGGGAGAGWCGRREGSARPEGGLGRRGFSLIELIVAILILTVGILGLAATAGQVTKMVGWGGRYGASAVVAGAQLEQLRATPCASLSSSGSATKGIFSLTWTITTSGNLRQISLTVTYPNGRKSRSDVYETARSCV